VELESCRVISNDYQTRALIAQLEERKTEAPAAS